MARQIQAKRMRRRSIKARTSKRTRRFREPSVISVYEPSSLMRTGTNPQNSVSFRGHGFPDRLTTNLVFAQSFILDPSALTIAPFKVFLLTSLFDPDNALGGGQPTYFDQLAAIYGRYSVNGAKITASFSLSTQTAANIGPYLCGIQTSDLTSLPSTDPGNLMSTPNSVTRLVAKEDGTVSLNQTYSKRHVYPDFDDNLQARVNANPTINWYAKVFASPQGVDVEIPINVTVRIEYNATFSDLVQVVDL